MGVTSNELSRPVGELGFELAVAASLPPHYSIWPPTSAAQPEVNADTELNWDSQFSTGSSIHKNNQIGNWRLEWAYYAVAGSNLDSCMASGTRSGTDNNVDVEPPGEAGRPTSN